MKKRSIVLLYSQLAIIIFFLSSLYCNANGGTCSISFEEKALELAMRAEELLKVPEIYNSEEGRTLAMANIEILRQWDSSEDPLFSTEQFKTLKENIERLEALSTSSKERSTSENSDNSIVPPKPTNLLNSVIANDKPIEPNKLYIVEPLTGGHIFQVVFSKRVVQVISQNKKDIRIKKSMKALLKGPIQNSEETSGIKRLIAHRSLFEIKIMGKKGVGNFRIGVFLHDGVYYLEDYTYQHMERTSALLHTLRKALIQATEGRYPAYTL